jgi:putative membrane protein
MSDEATRDGGRRGGRAEALLILIKGMLVGIANIIPGVSGGTFALILGIFDRLVGALNALGLGTVKVFLGLFTGGFGARARGAFGAELRRIDAGFLALLFGGSVLSILSSSFLIDYLLKEQYSPTLAFFVGLILPSVAVPWSMMDRRGLLLLWALPGIALTVGVSLVVPDNAAGLDNPLVAAGTGALAISAMVLPGISGSYVLLVLGQYQNALAKVTGLQRGIAEGSFDVGAAVWLGAMVLGMVVGILLFARVLDFLLKRFKSATMAFLIGLLLGSLWVLWPFKDIEAGAEVTDRSGEVKQEILIATAPNRLPSCAREGLTGLGAFAAGLLGSAGLIALGRRRGGDDSVAE